MAENYEPSATLCSVTTAAVSISSRRHRSTERLQAGSTLAGIRGPHGRTRLAVPPGPAPRLSRSQSTARPCLTTSTNGAGERQSERQVGSSADLAHKRWVEPGYPRSEDAAWDRRDVVQVDHAWPRHSVALGQGDLSIEPSYVGGDLGHGHSVSPVAMCVPRE